MTESNGATAIDNTSKGIALLAHLKNLRQMEAGFVAGDFGKSRVDTDPQGAIDQLADYAAFAAKDMRGDEPVAQKWQLAPRGIAELRADAAELAKAPKIPLGLPGVDEVLGGGMTARKTVVLGAFTSGGKTSVCLYEAILQAKSSHPVLYITAEEADVEIAARVESVSPGDDLPFLKIMPADGDIFEVLGAASTWVDEHDGSEQCPVVIIDYLQRLRGPDAQGRERQVAVCCEEIQTFGRKTGALVIAAAQLNRKSKEVEPEIFHLRESGLIEQIADVALLLGKVDQNTLRIKIGKNRKGRTGDVIDLAADWENLMFSESGGVSIDSIMGPAKSQKQSAAESTRGRIIEAVGKLHQGNKGPTSYLELAGTLGLSERSIKEHVPVLVQMGALRMKAGGGRGKPAEIYPAALGNLQTMQTMQTMK